MANLESLKVKRDDVVLIMSHDQATDLLATLRYPGVHTTETGELLTAYLALAIAQASRRDTEDFVSGVTAAIEALNTEPEVTGIDLWHEHRGVNVVMRDLEGHGNLEGR